MSDSNEIDKLNVPKHLAIIMDGNGRWAKERGKLRVFGHEHGVKTVRIVVEQCAQLKIDFLTLYTFSTENWNRPKIEVQTLMRLLVSSLKKELKTFNKNNIRLNTIGNIDALPAKAYKELVDVMEQTKQNTGMTLTLALSYGAREELQSMVKEISTKVKNNIISVENIDQDIINSHLYTHDLPDVDLLIRTSGEHRISNFLLWQIAYAELYFIDVYWPDFREHHLVEAIKNYQNRERRFGKTSEQLT
ncbi:MAG: isoprenyl transferase [Maribacter dokdonensis]|uniref:Isoprenyl transferase n=1 Tax=Maribacter dokdonensis TaxID=320912 RepID=A0A1H4N2B0_9FLAO|nr:MULTISPECIES: isoprenyl transferase [Maribacter]HAF77695.1 isoprenyl transferase [Maribacter sp.]APA64874.1 UDP pyrophosphate synthase [Maribacter sp. 1_2014MBL_MicDiv]KSA15004.1 Undecaprenyl diphosphate synthase [Maribacter dokdonensis DSW-8]MBU2900121.1 isoprenyl transferase [Maribacter dokdonensis]MDP2525557.1 isoprenyl transferase [Maribacter dokdonensis]|tara:strand:- start:1402 stop:2142 length:741 start_codon:yes stop_codon:yes gene_type:complete